MHSRSCRSRIEETILENEDEKDRAKVQRGRYRINEEIAKEVEKKDRERHFMGKGEYEH